MPSRTDVAVIGLGPSGAAAAITLAQAGLRVIAYDRPNPGAALGETVSSAILPLLGSLGISERFLHDCSKIESIGMASCWGSATVSFQDYMCQPAGRGWHLDRSTFNSMLRDSVAHHDNVQFEEGVAGMDVVRRPVRFVVNATGRQAGARTVGEPAPLVVDHLCALARFWRALPQEAYALVESHPQGWCYSAPQPGGRLVTNFCTDPETLRTHEDWDTLWNRLLERLPETKRRFVRSCPDSEWIVTSARSLRRQPAAGEWWIACGDAASSWDPLSGVGIARALASGVAAAKAVAGHLGGDSTSLGRYQRKCDRDFAGYLETRRQYYRAERRWPDERFWRARSSMVPSSGILLSL